MAKKYNKINGNLVVDTPKVVTFSTYAAAYQGCLDEDVPQDCLVVVENDGLYIWDGNQVTLTKLTEVGGGGVQPKYVVGDIMQLYGTTAPSDKWLKCDGSAFDTTRYADLYNLLGSGNTPDLNGHVLKGIGNNGNLSTHDPITLGAKLSANIGDHIHTIYSPGHVHSYSDRHTHTWDNNASGVVNGVGKLSMIQGAADKIYWPYDGNDHGFLGTSQTLNSSYDITQYMTMQTVGKASLYNPQEYYRSYANCNNIQSNQDSSTNTCIWYWCNDFVRNGDLDVVTTTDYSNYTGTSGKSFEIRAMEVSYFIRAEV